MPYTRADLAHQYLDSSMKPHSDYLSSIKQDGYVVIPNLLPSDRLQAIKEELLNALRVAPFGRNEFEGHKTQRLYALLAKFSSTAGLVEHATVLQLVDSLLPQSYLLSSAQAIQIHPGETPQDWHRDDSIGVLPMPRQHFGVSTIWAFDDFTHSNGATELIPGSHLWGPEIPSDIQERARTVEMAAGSVLIFLANLVHRGGTNRSTQTRLGVSPQYCSPWMRQSENMILAVPREKVLSYSGRLQSLLGYEVVHPGFAGHVNGRHPKRLLE